MLRSLRPAVGAYLLFDNHALVWIRSGSGRIEVDFRPYRDWRDRLIFLSPRQPVRFLSGDFEVTILEFPGQLVTSSPDCRVLFRPLISFGHIQLPEKESHHLQASLAVDGSRLLREATQAWFSLNPFQAEPEEYLLIFDLKELIDRHFAEQWSVSELLTSIEGEYRAVHRLLKKRIGLSAKELAQRKLLVESQREIALTVQPVQEVAYKMGFRDPAYFQRFFKRQTRLTPGEFREHYGQDRVDDFLQDLQELIQKHCHLSRSTAFYAQKLHMSTSTLQRKVRTGLGIAVGDLIREEIIRRARRLLPVQKVNETAFQLGFEEANHFSAFFKRHTGSTPTEYQSEKCNG